MGVEDNLQQTGYAFEVGLLNIRTGEVVIQITDLSRTDNLLNIQPVRTKWKNRQRESNTGVVLKFIIDYL